MIGQIISHYKILEKLGEGGMGVVYQAEDTKLKRTVALKFLPSELTLDPDAKQRFIHEAQAASALQHSNICTIHDIDQTNDGRLFMVMDCYDGETLKKKIEYGPLKIDNAIETAIQIAQGLSKAHEKGIVHRDIKPANVLITTDGIVKILDFGLAKLSGLSKLTKTGSTLGTAAYMSPEQAKGGVIDHRTDVWSLGVVLYEMISGRLPFKGDYEQAVTYQIVNAQPDPITGLRSRIPMELERIVNKCLEKASEDRYSTVADLIVDLKHVQRTTSQSMLLSTGKKIRFTSKKKTYFIAGILIVAAMLIVILNPFSNKTVINNKTIAVLPFTNLSGNQEDEYFTDGIMEDILTQISKIGELTVISRQTMMQYKGIKKSLKEIGKELNAGIALEGSVRRSGNRFRISSQLIDTETDKHLWADTYDRDMQDVFAVQSDVAQKIAEALSVKLTPKEKEYIEKIPTINTEAYDYYLKGREYYYRYKKGDNEAAIELFKKVIKLDPNFVPAWAGLADAFVQRVNRFGYPNNWYDSAMTISKKAVNMDNTSAEAYKALGLAYTAFGFRDSSIEAYSKALELNPNYWTAIQNTGYNYEVLGELYKSLLCFRKSDSIHPNNPAIYASRGDIYSIIGDDAKAEQLIMKASDLQLDNRDVYLIAVEHYISRGKAREAIELMNKLVSLNSDNSTILEYAGYVAAMAGNFVSARQYYQRSLALRSPNETINDSNGGTMWGYILMKEGKHNQAEKVLSKEKKLAMEQVHRGYQGGGPELKLSMIYAIEGKKSEAYTYLQKAIEGGQRIYQLILKDPRFGNIRNYDEFKKLIDLMKAKVEEQRKLIEQMEMEEDANK